MEYHLLHYRREKTTFSRISCQIVFLLQTRFTRKIFLLGPYPLGLLIYEGLQMWSSVEAILMENLTLPWKIKIKFAVIFIASFLFHFNINYIIINIPFQGINMFSAMVFVNFNHLNPEEPILREENSFFAF